jgi:hypothetical protein
MSNKGLISFESLTDLLDYSVTNYFDLILVVDRFSENILLYENSHFGIITKKIPFSQNLFEDIIKNNIRNGVVLYRDISANCSVISFKDSITRKPMTNGDDNLSQLKLIKSPLNNKMLKNECYFFVDLGKVTKPFNKFDNIIITASLKENDYYYWASNDKREKFEFLGKSALKFSGKKSTGKVQTVVWGRDSNHKQTQTILVEFDSPDLVLFINSLN